MQNENHQEAFLIELLQTKLPRNYCYHNIAHTLDVVSWVLLISKQEECSEMETHLLKTAAFWHDSGYIIKYSDHEIESCKLSQKYLPNFGYTSNEIIQIEGMIMATRLPQSPTNRLEEILADADVAYLATNEAEKKSTELFLELKSIEPSLGRKDWNKMQIDFLESHHYFSQYGINKLEPAKQLYLKKLKLENKLTSSKSH